MYRDNGSTVLRLSDSTCIQRNPESPDYQAFLQWQAKGNVLAPAPQPDPATVAKAELEQLERETFMNKGQREFFIVSMQDMAIRKAAQMIEAGQMNGTPISITPLEILNATPAWVRLLDINQRAIALERIAEQPKA